MKNIFTECRVCKKRVRRLDLNKISNTLICEDCQPSLFVDKHEETVEKQHERY